MPRVPGIGLRFALLICAVVLFTASVLVAWGFSSYREALLGQQLRELEVLAGSAEARLSQLARSVEAQVAAVAREDDLRSALRATVHGDEPSRLDELYAELEDLAVTDGSFAAVQLYDVSGLPLAGWIQDDGGLRREVVHYEFPAGPAALELARRLPEGRTRVLGPYVAEGAGGNRTLRLQVGAPVFDDNDSRIGVVYAEYDLLAAVAAIREDARRLLG